jgi:hypothetical protein
VKADRADVDEVARRLAQAMQAMNTSGAFTLNALQQQLERLQMLLNFKVDKAEVLSKIDVTRQEIHDEMGALERSHRVEAEKKLSQILERMRKETAVVEAKHGVAAPNRGVFLPVCDGNVHPVHG